MARDREDESVDAETTSGRPMLDSSAPEDDADDRSVYALDDLKRFSEQSFGVPSWDLEGAMHLAGMTSGTRKEVRAAVEAYLKREV